MNGWILGALLVISARGEPLEFGYNRVRVPEPFLWRKGDVAKHGKAPLYGAWNLVGDLPERIVLVEGETDCITLWMNGIAALGIPGSPGGWNDERHGPPRCCLIAVRTFPENKRAFTVPPFEAEQ